MSFSAQVAAFGNGTAAKLQQIRKAVTLKLMGAVVMDTPVLTGRLRANWQVSQGAPLRQTDETTDPDGGMVTREIVAEVGASDGSQDMFLTNSLPYAARIEFDGYSGKAPEGMLRRNVRRFNQLVSVETAKAKNSGPPRQRDAKGRFIKGG